MRSHSASSSTNPVSILNFLRLGLPIERRLSPDPDSQPLPHPQQPGQLPARALRTLPIRAHAGTLLRSAEESADDDRLHTEEDNFRSLDISQEQEAAMDWVCAQRTSTEGAPALVAEKNSAEWATSKRVGAMNEARERVEPNFESEIARGDAQERQAEAARPCDSSAHHKFLAFSNLNLAPKAELSHPGQESVQETQPTQRRATMTADRKALKLNKMKMFNDIPAEMLDQESLMLDPGFDDSETPKEEQLGARGESRPRRRRDGEDAGWWPQGASEEQEFFPNFSCLKIFDSDGIEVIDKFGEAKRLQELEIGYPLEQESR